MITCAQIDDHLVKDSVPQLLLLAKSDDPLYQFEGTMVSLPVEFYVHGVIFYGGSVRQTC